MRHTLETKIKTIQIKDEYVKVILTKEDIEDAIKNKVNSYLKTMNWPEIADEDIKFKDANSYPVKVDSCSIEINFNAT
jgi:hypothetical protein